MKTTNDQQTIKRYRTYVANNLTVIKDNALYKVLVKLLSLQMKEVNKAVKNNLPTDNISFQYSLNEFRLDLQMGKATIVKKMNKLEEVGLLTIDKSKNEKDAYNKNTYQLNISKLEEIEDTLNGMRRLERIEYINQLFGCITSKGLQKIKEERLSKIEEQKDMIINTQSGIEIQPSEINNTPTGIDDNEELFPWEEQIEKIEIAASVQYPTEYGIKGDTLLTTTLPTVQFDNIEYPDVDVDIEDIKIFNMESIVTEVATVEDDEFTGELLFKDWTPIAEEVKKEIPQLNLIKELDDLDINVTPEKMEVIKFKLTSTDIYDLTKSIEWLLNHYNSPIKQPFRDKMEFNSISAITSFLIDKGRQISKMKKQFLYQ